MRYKALLLLFVTSAILAKADTMTEYFQGTALSVTSDRYSGAPAAFYNISSGSEIIGSFSFDPSLGQENILAYNPDWLKHLHGSRNINGTGQLGVHHGG